MSKTRRGAHRAGLVGVRHAAVAHGVVQVLPRVDRVRSCMQSRQPSQPLLRSRSQAEQVPSTGRGAARCGGCDGRESQERTAGDWAGLLDAAVEVRADVFAGGRLRPVIGVGSAALERVGGLNAVRRTQVCAGQRKATVRTCVAVHPTSRCVFHLDLMLLWNL